MYTKIKLNCFYKIPIVLIIFLFLISCKSNSQENSSFNFENKISFTQNSNDINIDFSNSNPILLEKYKKLYSALNSVEDINNIAIISTSTANMLYEIGFIPKATADSSNLNLDLKNKQYSDGQTPIEGGSLNVGNPLNPNLESIVKNNIELILISSAVPNSKWIDSAKNLGLSVFPLYQSEYIDMFIILQAFKDTNQLDNDLINQKMLSMKNDLEFIQNLKNTTNNQKNEKSVSVLQLMPETIYFEGENSIFSPIINELEINNLYGNEKSSEVNYEDILIKNPDYLIVYQKGTDYDMLKNLFEKSFINKSSPLSKLDAIKNNNYILLGDETYSFIGSIDFNVTKAMKQIAEVIYEK